MHGRTRLLLSGFILVLTLAATAVMAMEAARTGADAAPAHEFQTLVGGLGFGPDVDLSRCAFSFDPRLCRSCPFDLGPIPAGHCFCPYHATSILSYPALDLDPDER